MSHTESLMPDRSHHGTGIKGLLFSCLSTPYVHLMVGVPFFIGTFKIIFDNHLNLLPMTWAHKKARLSTESQAWIGRADGHGWQAAR
jgi:hypothetical protein